MALPVAGSVSGYWHALWRQELVRRVGLNQQPVRGHVPESLALPGLALVREVAGHRKVGAQLCQRRDQFARPAKGVQQEAAARTRPGAEQFEQPAPRLQAMDAHRQVAFRGQSQLPHEHCLLRRDCRGP